MEFGISIITPWLDRPEFVDDYERASRAPGVEVIVIDNGSAADAAAALRAMVGRLGGQYLRNEENRWFSAANNQGLAVAGGRMVLFLNNDIAAEEGWLAEVARDVSPGGLFGPAVKQVQVEGATIAYLEGWCVAGSREVWKALGGWNAQAFQMPYWEDAELSVRASRAGIRLVKTGWRVTHKGNGTSGFVPGVLYGYDHNRQAFGSVLKGQPVSLPQSPGPLEPVNEYLRSGRLPEAERVYRRATEREPGRADLWEGYARILRMCGRFDSAISAARRAMGLDPNFAAGGHQEIAICLMNMGRNTEAAVAFAEVTRLKPDDVKAWSNLATALCLILRFESAIEAAGRAVGLKPGSAEPHAQLSEALLGAGRVSDARTAAEEAIRLNAGAPAGHHALGSALLAAGEVERALIALEKAHSLDPHNGETIDRIAKAKTALRGA